MNLFYVYVYYHPVSNEPIYVGKGTGDRLYRHLYLAHGGWFKKHTHFMHALQKILRDCGEKAKVSIFMDDLTEDQAHALEVELIAKYGRKGIDDGGILYNKCLGGEGRSGYRWTDEQRNNQSERLRGHKMPESTRQALLEANKGRKMPEGAVEKMAASKRKIHVLKDPDGNIIEVGGLVPFCKAHGLLQSGLRVTLRTGKPASRGPNKGWQLMECRGQMPYGPRVEKS